MEYDPASPTDEPDDRLMLLDLSAIPLPKGRETVSLKHSTNLLDIPLPPTGFVDILKTYSPLINEDTKQTDIAPIEDDINEVNNSSFKQEIVENLTGPLKFTLKSAAKTHSSNDVPNEASSIFESSKDVKNEEPRAMPKLQAMMKRSKPCQLPVGVLPCKTKLPPTEVKTELFLPTKESDISNTSTDLVKPNLPISNTFPTIGTPNLARIQSNDSNEMLSNAIREINALNNFAQLASSGTLQTGTNLSVVSPNFNLQSLGINNLNSKSIVTSTSSHIPNLMNLSVQPVHSKSLFSSSLGNNKDLSVQSAKVPNAIMQFVNPQKFRSAQMIATPLIANPVLASQSKQNEELLKAKSSRRRSRSRSHGRRRSRSRKRSHSRHRSGGRIRSRRHRSSSSSNSSKHRSIRKVSRSRRRSKDLHSPKEHEQTHFRRNRTHGHDRTQKSRTDESKHEISSHRKSDVTLKRKRSLSKEIPVKVDKKSNKHNLHASNDESEADDQTSTKNLNTSSTKVTRNYRGSGRYSSNTGDRDSLENSSNIRKDKKTESSKIKSTLTKDDELVLTHNLCKKSRSDSSSNSESDVPSLLSTSEEDTNNDCNVEKSKVRSKHNLKLLSDKSSSPESALKNNGSSISNKKSELRKSHRSLDQHTSQSLHNSKSVNIGKA